MKYKKLLASVLALAMIVGLVPGMVFAEETQDQDVGTEETVEEIAEENAEEQGETEETEEAEPEEPAAEIQSDAEERAYADEIIEDNTDYAAIYFGDLTADGTYVITPLVSQVYIDVQHDITTYGRIVIPTGADVIINLNGHYIDRNHYWYQKPAEGAGVFGVEKGAKLTVINGRVSGGGREGNGGGFNVEGTLVLDTVKVDQNRCSQAGAGIYINGGSGPDASITSVSIKNCEICSNDSYGRGSGIYIDGTSSVLIENTKIHDNISALNGSGIYINGNNGTVDVTIKGTTEITGNSAGDVYNRRQGGGIYMDGTSTVLIQDNFTASGNTAYSWGGGIAVMDQASLTLSGECLFGSNNSYRGESVYVDDDATFNISGKMNMFSYSQISDVALTRNSKINIVGKLEEGSKIRVDHEGSGIVSFTSGYSDYHTEPASTFFFANYTGNCIFDDNGEARIGCYYYDRTWDSATNTVTKTKKIIREFELLRYVQPSDDGYYNLGDKWYYVDIETTLDKPVRCFLDTKIILSSVLECNDGILVENGNSLSIYTDFDEDEEGDTVHEACALKVKVDDDDRAGIELRNTKSTSVGTLNVVSGCLDIKGGTDAASIGGGDGASGGNINVYGGYIYSGVNKYGAGIGGGEDADGGNITIYGGSVRAYTWSGVESFGAGIGGGENGGAGTIKIYGGKVVSNGAFGAAGIGCGKYGSGGTISVYGGDILGKCTEEGYGVGCGAEATGTVKVTLDYGSNGLKFKAMSFHGAQVAIKKPLSDGTNTYDPGAYSNVDQLENKTLVSCLFTGFSLLLDGQIGLNYFVYLPAEMIEGQVVKFTWTVNGVQKEFSHTVTASDLTEKGYKITCPMNAPEITRDVTLTVSVYGEPVSCETSVTGYAKYLLSNEYKASYVAEYGQDKYNKLAYLVKTMLDYGAKGQTKFSIDADNLANTNLDYTMKNVTSDMVAGLLDPSAVPDMSTGLDAYGLKYAGSAVVYMSKTSLRLFYKITDADKFDLVKDSVTFDGNQVSYVVSGNRVYFELENISAANLDHRYTLKIGESEYEFSALDYVRSCLDYSDQIDAAMLDLAKATYWYCKAANDFIEGA